MIIFSYKLYDVTPNLQQHDLLSHWQYEEGVDFFRFARADSTSKVLIAPARVEEFEKFLNNEKISYKIVMDDYEKALEAERVSIAENHKGKRGFDGRTGDFSIYWTYDEMEAYSFSLATRFPNLVQIETLTFSPENRRIYGLRISNGVFGQKPIIVIESGMHAREWAGPPTVFYLMHKLVEDPVTRNELLAQVDWLIVPMQNPDG
jgi:murein tripeptide amidase MpaA